MDFLYEDTIALVNSNLLGIIDVVDNEISFCTCNDTDIITNAGSTALDVGQNTHHRGRGA